MQLPVGSGRRFCRGFVFVSIESQQRLRSVGPPLSTPPFHHTPWGLLSCHQWLRRTVRSTWCALRAIFTAKVPSSHSPQGCLAWAWPAHPFDSLSASETGPRLLCTQHTPAMHCIQVHLTDTHTHTRTYTQHTHRHTHNTQHTHNTCTHTLTHTQNT